MESQLCMHFYKISKIRELFYIEHSKSFYQYLIDITFPCAFKQCVIYKVIEATFRNYYFNKKKITENVFVLCRITLKRNQYAIHNCM